MGLALNVLDLQGEDFDRIAEEIDDILEPAVEASINTPDYPELCKWDSHYVFIYDGMKHGFRRDRHLRDYDCRAVGWTKAQFRMWRSKGPNSYGVVMLDQDRTKTAPVYGEIYQVRPDTIRSLDWLHSNTWMTRRLRMPIDAIVDAKGTNKQIYAWVYCHLSNYWASRMDRLDPCDMLTANNNKRNYYNYMKKYESIGDSE